MHKKNARLASILLFLTFALGGLAAQDYAGIAFPGEDSLIYVEAPADWIMNTEDPEAYDLRPAAADPDAKKAKDLAIVKLNVLADEAAAASLTIEDMKQPLRALTGKSVDQLKFKQPEFLDDNRFAMIHLGAQGTYQNAPAKGKPLYVDLYLFRPAGEQVTSMKSFFTKGKGPLFALVYFTTDESEKVYKEDMDYVFDSLVLMDDME